MKLKRKNLGKWLLIFFILSFIFIKKENSYLKINNNDNKNIISDSYNSYEKKVISQEPFLILEIPKIKLKQNIYEVNSPLNQIKYHVTILPESIIIDHEIKHLFLAAHSGSGSLAYFKNLEKLNYNDEASIYYENVKITYQVKDIKIKSKSSNISMPINEENSLVLITCVGKEKQLIIYLNEIGEEKV